MKTPPSPELKPHPVGGKLALEVEIHTLPPLKLAGVAVKLEGRLLWLEPRAPKPGEVVIDATTMGKGERRLTVLAVDNRGALGRQDVYVTAADAGPPAENEERR